MSRRWDVLGGSDPRRVTFVLDAAGRIAAIFDPVKVDGHTEQVLEALARIGG
jgi:peroxiredoxin